MENRLRSAIFVSGCYSCVWMTNGIAYRHRILLPQIYRWPFHIGRFPFTNSYQSFSAIKIEEDILSVFLIILTLNLHPIYLVPVFYPFLVPCVVLNVHVYSINLLLHPVSSYIFLFPLFFLFFFGPLDKLTFQSNDL